MMENTYSDETGAYQKDYDRLVELVPGMGEANTIAGEMIRAIGKLGYELYNNGMGNNSSGAVNMLRAYGAIDGDTWETIHPMTLGRLYNGNYNGDSFQRAIESTVDQTIKHILDNPNLETDENTADMFDYQDDEEHYCEDCDEIADGSWGSLCQSCENIREEQEEEDDCYCC